MNNFYRSTLATDTATAITRTFCCLLLGLAVSAPVHAELKGEPGAIDIADRMLESIGGKALWAKIRTLYVIEKSRSEKGDGIIGEFWRDLQYPRESYTLNNRRDVIIRTWWNKQGFWQTLNGQVNHRLNPKLHQDALDYWHGEIYVMYHRLARGDDNLTLTQVDKRSFSVFDEILKRQLGTFWVNDDGELFRWRHEDGTEYIYGPHRSFGDISFPDWGTNVDGTWSFYYTEVRWSPDEPPVSFEAPK